MQWVSAMSDTKDQPLAVQNARRDLVDKWGVQHHSPLRWLSILTEELGEVAKEVCELELTRDSSPIRLQQRKILRRMHDEIAQVAAVAASWLCDLDGYEAECKDGNARFPDVAWPDPARWWEHKESE